MPNKVKNPRRVRARTKVPGGYRAVHRPTRWGNPYSVQKHGRQRAIQLYERWLDEQLRTDPGFLEPLRGYNLGCCCSPDVPCHADVILRKLYGTRGTLQAERL